MNIPKLSIIIAMYNIADYITICLESCLNQEFVSPYDYEVLVINDGSTDDSFEVASNFISQYTNARIITRNNGGLSEARNTGILEAKGDYIWFVDGDDKIEANAIHILLEQIKYNPCDAYIINYSSFDEKGVHDKTEFAGYDKPLSGEYIHNHYLRVLPVMAWLTVYKRSFVEVNKLRFVPNIIHEDDEFSLRAHHLCSSILILKESLYCYRTGRTGSIMSKTERDNTKSIVSWIKIQKLRKEFFTEKTPFFKSIISQRALLIISYRYSPQFNVNNIALYNSVKKELYRDVFIYGSLKLKIKASIIIIKNLIINK